MDDTFTKIIILIQRGVAALQMILTYYSHLLQLQMQKVGVFYEVQMRNFKNTEQHDLPNEEWRDLVSFPQTKGIYYISNLGRYKRVMKKGGFYYSLGVKTVQGYRFVDLFINGKKIGHKQVHDLVFEAFYRRLLPNEVVHHLSQVKNQNEAINLVAMDRGRHIIKHHQGMKYSQQSKAKMSKSQKGKRKSPEHLQKLSLSHLGNRHSEQQKRKISEGMKKVWQERKQRQVINTI